MYRQNPNRSLLRDGHALSVYGLKASDAIVVGIAGALAHALRFGGIEVLEPVRYLYALLAGVMLTLVVFSELGVYRTWRGGVRSAMYGRLVLGWTVVLGVLASISYLSKTGEDFSRLWFAYWAGIGLCGLVLIRLLERWLLKALHQRGVGMRRVAIVGPEDSVDAVVQRVSALPWVGYRITTLCTPDSTSAPKSLDGLRRAPNLETLASRITEDRIDEVWLTWPMREEARIRRSIELLGDNVVNIRWVPDIFSFRLINHGVTELAGMPMLDLSVTPISGINWLVKEVEDKVLASLIVLLISPILLAVAAGVKLTSRGPVLFKQIRHGWDGRKIEVWKFRSMRMHDEASGQVTQATRGDSRITPFGAFLRKTSLDELPQFFNVLQGRMSIVGPRPHAVAHNEQYKQLIPNYLLRHRMKPGITGWAQVNGLRGETDTLDKMRARVEYDLYYIEHWSVWFDLRIIAQTALKMFFDRSAY
ncbi:undecaprenyl-phosphate glucose phosphotransferase [Thauera propionica]|uniref:undecaprenyl-phosphate glucose phosphotransferase n=1 Tax=Thauera propionica TaxID=2019431 RepID=UPI0023F51BC9|nr:undecaprenyl-phosphate glucose phosphotransferase [Thauera propionica]MDD3675502.1 undecaprenyl-phosphate glucose phosphotransferase [Thauera propionica]